MNHSLWECPWWSVNSSSLSPRVHLPRLLHSKSLRRGIKRPGGKWVFYCERVRDTRRQKSKEDKGKKKISQNSSVSLASSEFAWFVWKLELLIRKTNYNLNTYSYYTSEKQRKKKLTQWWARKCVIKTNNNGKSWREVRYWRIWLKYLRVIWWRRKWRNKNTAHRRSCLREQWLTQT